MVATMESDLETKLKGIPKETNLVKSLKVIQTVDDWETMSKATRKALGWEKTLMVTEMGPCSVRMSTGNLLDHGLERTLMEAQMAVGSETMWTAILMEPCSAKMSKGELLEDGLEGTSTEAQTAVGSESMSTASLMAHC